MKFVVHGDPIPQKRARSGKKGFYDPQSEIKKNLKWVLASTMRSDGSTTIVNEPIGVRLYVHMAIPKTLAKKTREGDWHIKHQGDLDNFFKFYSDLMNGIVYEDDRCICQIYAEKRYSKNPRVEIYVEKLER